jgi:hypothetical protein
MRNELWTGKDAQRIMNWKGCATNYELERMRNELWTGKDAQRVAVTLYNIITAMAWDSWQKGTENINVRRFLPMIRHTVYNCFLLYPSSRFN